MSSSQKLIIIIWNITLVIYLLIIFIFIKEAIGLMIFTTISNLLFQYVTINSWNTGFIRVNGVVYNKKESYVAFHSFYIFFIIFGIVFSNIFGILCLLGVPRTYN